MGFITKITKRKGLKIQRVKLFYRFEWIKCGRTDGLESHEVTTTNYR